MNWFSIFETEITPTKIIQKTLKEEVEKAMGIKGKPFREYMQLLNLIIYWDIMDYIERPKENEKERMKENDQIIDVQP